MNSSREWGYRRQTDQENRGASARVLGDVVAHAGKDHVIQRTWAGRRSGSANAGPQITLHVLVVDGVLEAAVLRAVDEFVGEPEQTFLDVACRRSAAARCAGRAAGAGQT